MSDHTDCCSESRGLCEALFNGLRGRIVDLTRSESTRWCGFFQLKRNRFCYINHHKTMSRTEVWCLGELSNLVSFTPMPVNPRTATSGGFGKQYQARFFIDELSQIDGAVEVLYQES